MRVRKLRPSLRRQLAPLFLTTLTSLLLAAPASADFVEVGGLMGVAYDGPSRSIAWTDFDGDGWLDAYVGNVGTNNLLLRNRIPTGLPFVNVSIARGVTNTGYPSWGVSSVDYDNDGDLDLYVANDFLFPCRLYRNDGWLFAEVAEKNGVQGAENNMGLGWADADSDGDLDFLMSIWGPNFLFRGDGRGGFSNLSPELGTGSLSIGFQVSWADWDNDGDQDLFNANIPTPLDPASHLYRNDGGDFAEVSSQVNPLLLEDAVGASWCDFDSDGDMDLFVARGSFLSPHLNPNRLYRNDGGVFNDIAGMFPGMADSVSSFGGVWADYDLDGDQDLFVDGGHAHQLWRNDNGAFADVAVFEGLQDPTNPTPRGAAWGDYDRDGDPDLMVAHRGAKIRLWRNDNGNGNHWLNARFYGTVSNRDAIGAKIDVTAGAITQHFELNAGEGYFSQGSPALEIGLGSATTATISVEWPSGIVELFSGISADQEIVITEGVPVPGAADFDEVAVTVGLDGLGEGRGSAWGDYDADGDLDLYVANVSGSNSLMRNDGGSFIDLATLLGVDESLDSSYAVVFADYDNDGLLDLYVSNLGGDCRLFHNTGSGFADVATAMGLVSGNQNHWGAAWADFDNDGDVDLYQVRRKQANSLYRNDGTGFVDVAPALGIDFAGKEVMAVWGDYDNDGFSDLYIASRLDNYLLHNDGGTFSNVTVSSGTSDNGKASGVSWADTDNDGDLDLYIANNGPNKYFENQGAGLFISKEIELGIGFIGDDNSPLWGDFDADGLLDLVVVSEGGTNRLLKNNGAGFTDISTLKGTGHYGYGESAGWVDHDGDGDLDLHTVGNGERNRFFDQIGSSGGNWLRIRPVGVISNSAAIGARIEVDAGGVVQTRYVQAGSGWLSQGDLWPQFGLGAATTADRITIDWPSGVSDAWVSVAAGQELVLTEGSGIATDVESGGLPKALAIVGNYPNPFNPVTQISFDVPIRGFVELSIYDAGGREVRRLVRESLAGGNHTVTWNGRDHSGHEVGSGVYLSKLKLAGVERSHKMVLVR